MIEKHEPERREHRRVKVVSRVDVLYEDHTSDSNAKTGNISESGFFAAAGELFSPGTILGVGMRPLEDFPPIRARAEVMWVRSDADGEEEPRGMGLKFIEVDEGGQETISALVGAEPELETGADSADPMDMQQPLNFFPDGVKDEAPGGAAIRGAEEDDGVPPITVSAEGKNQVAFTLTFEDEAATTDEVDPGRSQGVRQLGLAVIGLAIVVGVLWALWPKSEASPRVELPVVQITAETVVSEPAEDPEVVPGDDQPAIDDESGVAELEELFGDAPKVTGRQAVQVVPVPLAVVLGGVSKLSNISWREEGGAELITIRGNAEMAEQQVSVQLLDDPPRCLVRLVGIDEPFYRDRLRVGLALVRSLRMGWHHQKNPKELHIVLDLSTAAVDLESSVDGDTLTVEVTAR